MRRKRGKVYDNLIASLKRDEGFSSDVYLCSSGVGTIGYGTTCVDEVSAEFLLKRVVAENQQFLFDHDFYLLCSDVRRSVLEQMCYQLGLSGLLKFRRMIAALEAQDYSLAAREMLNSRWAKQTSKRVRRLARQMRTGRLSNIRIVL